MALTLSKNIAIGEEVRTSIKLIKAGLGQFQGINGANDFYHLPILNLANGFERLMKTIICFHALHISGDFPNKIPWPCGNKGHDLEILLNKVTLECFSKDYLRLQCAKTDHDYLCNDALFRKIIRILSEFGQKNRYYYLDIVLNQQKATSSMEQQWQQLEFDILARSKDWQRKIKENDIDKNLHEINQEIIIMIEKSVRALTRLFTIGGLGNEAKRYTGYISRFLFLRDDQLGKQTY